MEVISVLGVHEEVGLVAGERKLAIQRNLNTDH